MVPEVFFTRGIQKSLRNYFISCSGISSLKSLLDRKLQELLQWFPPDVSPKNYSWNSSMVLFTPTISLQDLLRKIFQLSNIITSVQRSIQEFYSESPQRFIKDFYGNPEIVKNSFTISNADFFSYSVIKNSSTVILEIALIIL